MWSQVACSIYISIKTSFGSMSIRAIQLPVALSVSVAALLLAGCSGGMEESKLPDTPKIAVTDTYHGVEVTEQYRWLEDHKDPKVRAWNDAQHAYARSILDALPDRPAIQKRLQGLLGEETPSYYRIKHRNGTLFALKRQPPHEQSILVAMESADDPSSERVVLDLNVLNPEATTTIDFYSPSPDGKVLAVSLSEKGSEIGDLFFYDIVSGKRLGDRIPYVNGPTAGGSIAWFKDGTGVFYTRYPRAGERPEEDLAFYQQVYCHRLGTPTEEDTYEVGKDFPRIAEIRLDASHDGTLFLATVANGDGGEYAHYLRDKSGKWAQVTQFDEGICAVRFGPDNSLYMLSYQDAPNGRILRMVAGETDTRKAKVVVPESDVSIYEYLPTDSRLYVIDMAGGPRDIRMFDLQGKLLSPIRTPPVSSAGSLVDLGDDNILFNGSSFVAPPTWYRFEADKNETHKTALIKKCSATFDDIEVVREFAVSKDGTKIPMNIMQKKGTQLDGKNPTILYGYGGYGICKSPEFDVTRRLWFDQGGVYVVANIRGGGEYGEDWHKEGYLTNKQNVFDDFIACANYLIDSAYTTPKKLAIWGGSNGGLLMGAVMTQHPELFRVVVSRAGVYDMLRTELEPNGVFNITEYGTVKDPEQFRALYAYSPYHHVVEGTAYPAVLFTVGTFDGRVNPWQSRKMLAALQEANSSDYPLLMRTSEASGHGHRGGLTENVNKKADQYAFLMDQLGMKYRKAE